MTKNKDILKPFEVIERQTLEVENVVEKNKYFTILFFSQLYTQLDTCQNFHPYAVCPWALQHVILMWMGSDGTCGYNLIDELFIIGNYTFCKKIAF